MVEISGTLLMAAELLAVGELGLSLFGVWDGLCNWLGGGLGGRSQGGFGCLIVIVFWIGLRTGRRRGSRLRIWLGDRF